MDGIQQRVFMIGWEYPPHNSGGLGIACQGMTEALSQQNTQIYFTLPYLHPQAVTHMKVIHCQSDDSGQFRAAPPFSTYSSVNSAPIKFSSSTSPIELSSLAQSEMEHQVNEYAEKVLSESKKLSDDYSVVHAHDWMSFPAAMKIQANLGKPFIAHVHSTEFDRIPSGHGSHYIAHTEYMGLQQANKVIAVSHFTKKMLIDKYFVDPSKIVVVHNGVSPITPSLSSHFAANRPVIVFMGRLTAQKGAEYFIELANSVLQKIPEALFVVAGSGDQYHYLLLRNADQHLSASVLFTGFIRDRQREVLLDRADVFVMPSLSEPFGLVALEAAQRHTPVIVSTNSGVREIMSNSIQVDFWDINKMRDEIVKLITNQDYRQQVMRGQNENLKEATWERSAQGIRNVYHDLITGAQ